MSDVYQNYLLDLGFLLKEEAEKAKLARDAARGTHARRGQSVHMCKKHRLESLSAIPLLCHPFA